MSLASLLVYLMEAVIVALQHSGPISWAAQSEMPNYGAVSFRAWCKWC